MTTSVTNLVSLLKNLEEKFDTYTDIITTDYDYDYHECGLVNDPYFNKEHSVIKEIISEALKYLITNSSQPNHRNIAYLEEEGFTVRSGEIDQYGWFSGVIYTKKGVIIFK